MSDPTFIRLENITKEFGSIRAVDDVSISIAKGEFFSLLGPSGCGKTTLLRILSGLELPSSGKVFVDGEDISTVPPYLRPTNMVFQSYAVFPHLNVAENIAFGLRPQRVDRRTQSKMVSQILELIGLAGYGSRRPNELSGGQLQRVALARALILKPKVLLLDEPLAALDKKLRERMQIELRSIQQDVGITFVFVTHDQEEALTLSDRVAVMSGGKLLQCSSPRNLYERPINHDVAEFVGEMNFVRGQVRSVQSRGIIIELPGFGEINFPKPEGVWRVGGEVDVALRPEWLYLSDTRPTSRTCSIVGCSYYGNRCLYQVEIPGLSKPLLVAQLNTDSLIEGRVANIAMRTERAVLLNA